MKAGQLRDIIEKIEKAQKLSRVEISAMADVNRSYLSNLLSEDEEKVITDKLLRKFQVAFPSYFQKGNKTNKSVPREVGKTNGNHTPGNDLQAIAGHLTETGTKHEAALNIIIMTLAELVAAKSGKSTAYEHSELLRTISSESDRLLSERRKTG